MRLQEDAAIKNEICCSYCDFITEFILKTGYTVNVKNNRKGENIMSVLHINQKNYEMIENSEKTVLLDFYADWCGPCRMVSPLIDEIAKERDDILVAKINVDDEQELAGKFGVFSIPTLVVMKNGKVVKQSTGARPKAQILTMLAD